MEEAYSLLKVGDCMLRAGLVSIYLHTHTYIYIYSKRERDVYNKELTALARHTGEMILVIFEIGTFERHETDHGGLFGFRGDVVRVERGGGELGGLFGGGAFALGWGVVAGGGFGGDGCHLGFCYGGVAGEGWGCGCLDGEG